MPSHHQSAFFDALRQREDVDLLVRYYGTVTPRRVQLGWQVPSKLPIGEMTVEPNLDALTTIPDWQTRIHIIEGRDGFRRQLIRSFCENKVCWIHWGERGARRWSMCFRFPFWCLYGRLVAKHALGAFAIGAQAAKDFRLWGIPGHKIAFLPYAVAPLSVHTKPDEKIERFAKGRKIFMYCGELSPHKGIDVLLQSFASMPNDEWVLILVGPDRFDSRYQALAQRLGIQSKIYFRGVLPADHIANAMILANVFILPSRYDGWGVVLNEAASMAKALISTTACGAADHLINNNKNGYSVQPNDFQALAKAMKSYVYNPLLDYRHGQQSLVIFREFSPQCNASRLTNALFYWLKGAKAAS